MSRNQSAGWDQETFKNKELSYQQSKPKHALATMSNLSHSYHPFSTSHSFHSPTPSLCPKRLRPIWSVYNPMQEKVDTADDLCGNVIWQSGNIAEHLVSQPFLI